MGTVSRATVPGSHVSARGQHAGGGGGGCCEFPVKSHFHLDEIRVQC